MPKAADRNLRDLLEQTQAEVKRLKNALAERNTLDPAAARRRVVEAELQAARLQVQTLERENARLHDDRGTELVKLQAELKQSRGEAAQARDEAKQLQTELEKTAKALARAQERSQQVKGRRRGEAESLLARLRLLFDGATKQELERAQREIARLNQQLSRVQPLRPGRR